MLKAAQARNAAEVKKFADIWGYESTETDWRKLLDRKDIDAIDICTPNNTHAEIAPAAAAAGKMILCEKPLAMNGPEGLKMVTAVEKAKVPNMVWYNYRRVPAVTLAKRLIEEGKLGRIFHYRAKFLQDWTIKADLPQGGQGWRLDVAAAAPASAATCHALHRHPRWLNGEFNSLAMTETFARARTRSAKGALTTCASWPLRRTAHLPHSNDALCRGHTRTPSRQWRNASIFWDLHDLHRLQYFDYRDESRTRGWR